jgi:2-polyprenyl-3-methyl-5-hydroxy-6-metoxy-1,4-benzoquinol methylase
MTDNRQFQLSYGWQNAEPTEAYRWLYPSIKSFLPADKTSRILEIGCGNGYLAAELAMMGHTVVGTDVSSDGIEIAKTKYPYPNIHFETRSVYDGLNDLMTDVDVVVSSEVIEHLYSPKTLIDQAFSVLRPGGMLIITTPYHGYLKNIALSLFNKWDFHHTVDWEGGHIKFFSQKTLSSMLNKCGFVNIQYRNAGRIKWLWKCMVCRAEKPVK